MAHKEELEEAGSRKNEWEVVSLSASAYAASPDPEIAGIKGNETEGAYNADTEISRALFMSSHFVFPPGQHENLPLEPEAIETREDDSVKGDASEIVPEGSATSGKDDVGGSFGASPIIYSKSRLLGDNDHRSTHTKDFEGGMNLDGFNPTEDMPAYSGYGISSFLSEAVPGGANQIPTQIQLQICQIHPCREKQERWRVLQVKWQMTVNNEKMGRMLAPIYRFKDALARSHRHGSLIRASSSTEN
ncbi:hypothetical protein MLD38_023464 [Melastoma candidum]|uniref:Uncharacterized protein n=1 Tax=Melastoma candidum TaxID=119954 RepID=A0ACB9NQE5_9MYRT|nr:hypothetical protein MLD38_023464 [Melastoma candidum]